MFFDQKDAHVGAAKGKAVLATLFPHVEKYCELQCKFQKHFEFRLKMQR